MPKLTLNDRVKELEEQHVLLAQTNTSLTQALTSLTQALTSLTQTLKVIEVKFKELAKNGYETSHFVIKLAIEHYGQEEFDNLLKKVTEQYKTDQDFQKIIDSGLNSKGD